MAAVASLVLQSAEFFDVFVKRALGTAGIGSQDAELLVEGTDEERVAIGIGPLGLQFGLSEFATMRVPGCVDDAIEDELLVAGVGGELTAEVASRPAKASS